MSTRAERLAQASARTQAVLDGQRKRYDQLQAAQQSHARKARDRRRYQVGKLMDQAGLLTLDDPTLEALVRLLVPLAQTPDPVAVLESLLASPGGLDL